MKLIFEYQVTKKKLSFFHHKLNKICEENTCTNNKCVFNFLFLFSSQTRKKCDIVEHEHGK